MKFQQKYKKPKFIFLSFFLFFILPLISSQNNSNSFCGSNHLPKISPEKLLINFTKISNNKTNNRKLSTEYTPIQFKIDYTYLEYQFRSDTKKIITLDNVKFIKKTLESATSLLSELLSVIKNDDTYVLDDQSELETNCNLQTNYYDTSILTTGISSDTIIIYPKFINFTNGETKTALAAASCCAMKDDKPIAGYIFIEQNITETELNKENIDKYYTMLFLHQLTHILVFDKKLFNYFTVVKNNIINNATIDLTILGLRRTLIKTPKVVEVASKHFNCNLTGIELENQNYDFSNSKDNYDNHWESRIMLTDYMTAVNYDEIVISDITLALFEDSGWYKVNYYSGGLFRYGKNQGCGFLNNYCAYGGKSNYKNEFCILKNTNMCTPGRLNRGTCGLKTYNSDINYQYRHFSDSKLGGHLPQADYCPVANTNSSFSKTYYYQGNCNYGENENYPEILGYKLSENSICLLSSLTPKNQNELKNFTSNFRALCYKVECLNVLGEKVLRIYIGDDVIVCPESGGVQTLDNYNGFILCPDYNLICTGTVWCNDAITCVEKHSETSSESYVYNYVASTTQDYQEWLTGKFANEENNKNSGSCLIINFYILIIVNFILIFI